MAQGCSNPGLSDVALRLERLTVGLGVRGIKFKNVSELIQHALILNCLVYPLSNNALV